MALFHNTHRTVWVHLWYIYGCKHFLSACVDDNILIPNVSYRAPEMAIPEPPTKVDLKIDCEPPPAKTQRTETVNKKWKINIDFKVVNTDFFFKYI